jgi:lipid-binding SYLF domain-containing protein
MLLKTICLFLALGATLALSESSAFAQKPKWAHAIERSGDAGRIMSLLALVPDSGLPKELVDKAEAVGVFPKVRKETAFFTTMSQGYGVISSRQESGWSLPAFYAFGGGGYGNPFAKNEASAVVLLFMTKDALGWFEKGGVPLKNEKKALAGPVGAITDEQRKEMEGAQILAYSYYNGKLDGTAFGKSFWKNFALNPDNNINKPVYGMKGREVLAGKEVDSSTVPTGISAYQEALEKYFPRCCVEPPKKVLVSLPKLFLRYHSSRVQVIEVQNRIEHKEVTTLGLSAPHRVCREEHHVPTA